MDAEHAVPLLLPRVSNVRRVPGFGGRVQTAIRLILLVLGLSVSKARGQDAVQSADAGRRSESTTDGGGAVALSTTSIERMTAEYRTTAEQIRMFSNRALEASVAPRTLFDISLSDRAAVELEAARLTAFLDEVDRAKPRGKAKGPPRPSMRDAGLEDRSWSESLWNARIELDRARLAFYSLPEDERDARFGVHEELVAKAHAAATETEAEKKERAAEEERARALEAARVADTESTRLVAEEYARLLEVEREQARFAIGLTEQAGNVAARKEASLKLQRRARERREALIEARDGDADALYQVLRTTLRASRDAFSAALEDGFLSNVPQAGPNPLAELRLDSAKVSEQRKKVDAESFRLATEVERIREDVLQELLEETTTLNRERLSLIPYLSSERRDAITGFSEAGRDQAAAELRQLTLILRDHRHETLHWIKEARAHPGGFGTMLARSALVIGEWTALFLVFLWWRRRAESLLEMWRQRIRANDPRAAKPSLSLRLLVFVSEIRSSLEWLLFAVLMRAFLPRAVKDLLEVELLSIVLIWMFAGRFVVDVLDSIAEGTEHFSPITALGTPGLRHRSLRFVGRVVVGFGVVLVLSARLVGRGAIYEWVSSFFWIAVLPVFLVLIRWWRDTVFARLAVIRKPSAFERWVLEHRKGWSSFLAASVGGLYLFVRGASRATVRWVSHFEITRRGMAYLFRRELDKLGEEEDKAPLAPLAEEVFHTLGPETADGDLWIKTRADEGLDLLAQRVETRRGGIVAVVAERGAGKTTALRHACRSGEDVLFVETSKDLDDVRERLALLLGLPKEAVLEEIGRAIATRDPSAIVLDDFQHFAQPTMGGLHAFDTIIAFVSRHSDTTTWLLSFDEVTWPFLERARQSRPVFDEILRLPRWREEEIAQLVRARTAAVGLDPSFARLMDALPATADEIDRKEASESRAASYYRLVWDHAGGNPGVALHIWRRSLGLDEAGKICVRVFQALDLGDLERLPDSSIFVLKAVLQLAPAAPNEIARATMVRTSDVIDALRYFLGRGYVEETEGRYRVTWTWFRAATQFLKRRHLLVSK